MATHWQYAESFADTNLKMLENEALCDVTFAAGNEQKLKNVTNLFSPAVVQFWYLYSGKVELKADTVLSLLYAAKKYNIPGLDSHCKSFLSNNIDADNVCTILDQAIVFYDEDLKTTSLDFIMYTSDSLLKSDAFVRMSKSGLQEVLKLDTCNASECDLYVGCKRWAAQRCRDAGTQETDEHIRQELGDKLIGLIRFPTLTSEEFTDVVASGNVLNKDELLSV